ncbi:hypothetical protein ABPG72_020266 [Tetrahymena utriculariae]
MAACKVQNRNSFYSPQNITNKSFNKSTFNFKYCEIISQNPSYINSSFGLPYQMNNFIQPQSMSSYLSKNSKHNYTVQKKINKISKLNHIKDDKIQLNDQLQIEKSNKDYQDGESLLNYQEYCNSLQSNHFDHMQSSQVKKLENQLTLEKEIKNDRQSQEENEDYHKNSQEEQDEEEEEEEEEEEFSIWDEKDLEDSGVDTNRFIDDRGTKLEFYQIERIRSSLYQPQYVSRLDTIKAVQTISCHYNQEISVNQMKQQQGYLDQYFVILKEKKSKSSKQGLQELEMSY